MKLFPAIPEATVTRYWLLGILLIAALLRIYLVTLDMDILLDQGLIQDDAFYYYEIAHYLLKDGVPSFDGIHPTNGFHPLWQAICLPIFATWDGELPLRVMLALAALLDLCSILIVFSILHHITQHDVTALCGAAFLAFHGALIRTWFNGMETALHLLTLLLFVYAYLQHRQSATTSWQHHALLGLLAGIAFLARTDSAVITAIMLLFLYLPRLLHKQWRGIPACGATLLLVITPWLWWNWHTFGNVVQISGQVQGGLWLVGGTPTTEQALWADMLQGVLVSLGPIGNVFKKVFWPFPIPDAVGHLFLLPLLLASFFGYRRDPLFAQRFRQLLPFLLGVAALFFYHAGVRLFVRSWYSTPVMVATALWLCLLASGWLQRTRVPRAALALATFGALLLVLHTPWHYTKRPPNLPPDPRVAAARWLNEHLAADTRVGAANAGIVGYFAIPPVINLDGVVNETAFRAREQDEIHRYVFENGIEVLVDHKGSMAHLCRDNAFYRCEEAGRWGSTVAAWVRR